MNSPLIANLKFYLHNFYMQDFLLLAGCVLGFFILLIIALALRRFATLASLLIVFAFIGSIASFIYAEGVISSIYRPYKLSVSTKKRLAFSKNVALNLQLENLSERTYKTCKITLRLQKPSKNSLEAIMHYLKPIRHYDLRLNNIAAKEVHSQTLVLPLKSQKKFFINASAVCF